MAAGHQSGEYQTMNPRPTPTPASKAAAGFYSANLDAIAKYMGDCWPRNWIRRHEGRERWEKNGWYVTRDRTVSKVEVEP
jgi:hypothetical protein